MLEKRVPNLLYVTFGENVLESGILYCQVREMLISMKEARLVEQVHLISFISIRLWFRKRTEYKIMQKELAAKGIGFSFPFSFSSQKWSWFSVPIAYCINLPILLRIVMKSGCNIIHSRSYMASYLAGKVSKITGIPYIFDPRGPYPEEMVANNRWRLSGKTYTTWKRIEQYISQTSSGVIGVTTQMRDDYKERGAKLSIFVPNRTNVSRFNANIAPSNETSDVTMIFNGELDTISYNPELIARIYSRFHMSTPNLKLQLLSRQHGDYVEKGLAKAGLESSQWTLASVNPGDMPNYLAKGHFGLVLGIDHEKRWDVFPVKFAEYLAAGLPVLLDRNCGHFLSAFVQKHGIGIVFDKDDDSSFLQLGDMLKDYEEISKTCRTIVRTKLDISRSAQQYARLYKQILGDRTHS
ncbi:hypothetical protein ACFLQV_00580 [Calditrichota bacterium]